MTWEFCRGADPEVVSEYHNWLTSAAESGYLPALLAWGSDFPGDEQRELDDAEDRRYLEDRFRDRIQYLERAKAAGSIEAIQKLSTIYRMGELNPLSGIERDPVNSFAHMYAYAWFQLQYENNERYFRYLHEMGMRLSPREFREAVERGQEILASEQCCITIAVTELPASVRHRCVFDGQGHANHVPSRSRAAVSPRRRPYCWRAASRATARSASFRASSGELLRVCRNAPFTSTLT